jgi:Alpha/beta hydrolase domain
MAEVSIDPVVRSVPGKPFVTLGAYDLEALGYGLEEFFVSGTATSYTHDGTPADGQWDVQPGEAAPYVTRILAVKPAESARFNGSVIVEWLNVSGGRDAAVEWVLAHRAMMRAGFAYIGVSAQRVGIDGGLNLHGAGMPLKVADPERYGGLVHPDDAFAYDIFTQIGRVLRVPGAGVLGALVPQRLIAVGASQSAMYLATYATAIDPVARVFDGFLVHSRFGYGAGLDGQSVLSRATTSVALSLKMRADLRVPVLTVVTETDVIGGPAQGFYSARQPDAPHLRVWEIAGAAHADNYIYRVGSMDSGFTSIGELAAAYAPIDQSGGPTLDPPMNFGPQHHYVVEAALVGLDEWVRTGTAPAAAAPLQAKGSPAPGEVPQLVCDAHGIALGGVRTPWVDVPTARLAGTRDSGPPMAWIVGTGEPFDAAKLDELYPGGRGEYLRRFAGALESSIKAGFILPEDRQEILDLAAVSYRGAR